MLTKGFLVNKGASSSTVKNIQAGKKLGTNTSEASLLCRACNLMGKDCCHSPHPIFVGIREAINIHLQTGLKYSAFLIYTKFDDDQFLEAFNDLIPSGKIIALKRKGPLKCVFHTENGCCIPDYKPFICRVFPFWYDQEILRDTGRWELFIEERDCLVRARMLNCQSMEECCQFMGLTEEKVKRIFKGAFEHYELARRFEHYFDTMNMDSAFEEIEKELQRMEPWTTKKTAREGV